MSIYRLGNISPEIKDISFIADSADIIGNVRLEGGVSIWFGAVLRGDNDPIVVGEGSNIQDGAVVHSDPGIPATIGRDCVIGHRAIVHGCTIGDNTLVGMGAVVLNRAVIGKNCIIGAGALVKEGMEIPDNSLVVGVPAKVVRQLDDIAVAEIRSNAENYVRNGHRFAKELSKIS